MASLVRPFLARRAAELQRPTPPPGAACQVGVVTTVDPAKGELTLALRREVRLHLTGPPGLLQGVRPWRVVDVRTEGTVVRALRCL